MQAMKPIFNFIDSYYNYIGYLVPPFQKQFFLNN